MRRLRKFTALEREDQALIALAAVVLLLVKGGLRFLPFQSVYRLLSRVGVQAATRSSRNAATVDRIVEAVTLAGRHIPGSTCLTEALTLRLILAMRGYPATIRIGMARSSDGQVEGHAWVEMDGKTLWTRDEDVARYVPMPLLEKPEPWAQ